MTIALSLMAFLFPVHHHAPPPPPAPVMVTIAAPAAPLSPRPPAGAAPVSVPTTSTTTTTTAPPPAPAPAVVPAAAPAVSAPAVSNAPPSWQVSWIVRCPPAQGIWYTYQGSLAQAQIIYNQQVALIGSESSPGCYFGSVSDLQQG